MGVKGHASSAAVSNAGSSTSFKMRRKVYLPSMVQAITVLTVLKMLTNGKSITILRVDATHCGWWALRML